MGLTNGNSSVRKLCHDCTVSNSSLSGKAVDPSDNASLRADVRKLGDLLGESLVRQEGPELLALVEKVRQAVREGNADSILANLTVDESVQLVRAFSTYFNLALSLIHI